MVIVKNNPPKNPNDCVNLIQCSDWPTHPAVLEMSFNWPFFMIKYRFIAGYNTKLPKFYNNTLFKELLKVYRIKTKLTQISQFLVRSII